MWFRRQKNKGLEESEKAFQQAQRKLRMAQVRGEEVSKVVDAIREIRERNHFAEALGEAIIRPKGT